MIAMHKSKSQLHVKNLQKQQLTKSKIKNVRKSDLQGNWRYAQLHGEIHDKPLQTVQKQKKPRLAVHDVKKLCKYHYSKTRRENRIATKRGAPYSHIAIGHSLFLVCIGVVGAIDKKLFTFFEGNRKQTKIHIWQDTVFTLQLFKKFQKLIEKHGARVHPKTQLIASLKQFQWQLLQKNNSFKSPIND